MKMLLFPNSSNRISLDEIENHLERSDARFELFERAEAKRECREMIRANVRLAAAVLAILCAVSAIFGQF